MILPNSRKRGRPKTSHDVRVIPEFREQPDIEKLARALLAVAMNQAKEKEPVDSATKSRSIQIQLPASEGTTMF